MQWYTIHRIKLVTCLEFVQQTQLYVCDIDIAHYLGNTQCCSYLSRVTMVSLFSRPRPAFRCLQVMESWSGPGNKVPESWSGPGNEADQGSWFLPDWGAQCVKQYLPGNAYMCNYNDPQGIPICAITTTPREYIHVQWCMVWLPSGVMKKLVC